MKNEYEVTWELYKEWLRENRRKKPRRTFLVIWIVMGLCFLGLCLWEWAMGRGVGVAYMLAFALLCFNRAFTRDWLLGKRQYAQMVKNCGQDRWIRTIEFREDMVLASDGNASVHWNYSDMESIREEGNHVWITLKNRLVIRLYKDKFVDADWERCRTMLAGKTGWV